MEKKILGYRKFNSKKGSPLCLVQLVSPFTDQQIQNGACGNQAEDVWIPDSFHNMFTPQVVGKMADLGYDVVNGRAYVASVTIK